MINVPNPRPLPPHRPDCRPDCLTLLGAGVGSGAIFMSTPAVQAAETASGIGDAGGVTTLLLASALVLSIGAIALLYVAGEKSRAARKSLADFATEIGKDSEVVWRSTGVADIDAVAQQMQQIHSRLQEKRSRIAADQSEIRAAREHGRVMDLELHHRVNNAMAMIQGIANITARTANNFNDFRAAFNERVQCLSRISTLLVRKSWAQTPLLELVETVIDKQWADRIKMSGPDIDLRSEVALALGMALHELLTNAEQHGALSTESGGVTISWQIEPNAPDRMTLIWVERDGPLLEHPQPYGVGHYLIRNVLARQFGGEADIAFEREGLRVTLTAQA